MTAAASWLGLLVDAAKATVRVRDLAAQPWPSPRPCLRSKRLLRTGAANFCWRPGASVPGYFGHLLVDTRVPVPLTHNATTGGHLPRLPGDVHRDPKDGYPLRRRGASSTRPAQGPAIEGTNVMPRRPTATSATRHDY
jgi:hypothetical protein